VRRISGKLLVALFLGITLIPIAWANQEIETSTVFLAVKSGAEIIAEEPLFEILDFERHILVPLNGLSAYLPYSITYDREANTVSVTDQVSKRQGIIDLKNRKYVVENEFRWLDQTPFTLNGEFYVSPSLIEYLVDVKIEWSYKYQELIIQADWMEPKQDTILPEADEIESDTKINYLGGPKYSLGSIRYKLGWEYREDEYDGKSNEGSLELRGDGRAGSWAISLGGKVEWDSNEATEAMPSLIRAKYNENNQLIIFGDADVYFENTVEQQRVRGILYMTPDDSFSRYLAPHTVISGPAGPGDKVTLLVNGKEKGEMIVGPKSKEYRFDNVPLLIKRLNTVKVIVKKPTGEQLITEKNIAASLRILEDEAHSVMATTGKYKRYEDDEEWIGELTGFKTRHKLFNNTISFDCEATRIKLYDDSLEPASIGADTGIAFRLGEHTVCALDWLVGGVEDEPQNGWESSLLYCLENGYIEGIVFYIDPAVSNNDRVQVEPGKGVQVLAEIEISERTGYLADAKIRNALPDMYEFNSLRDVNLWRAYKFGPTLDNRFIIGLRNIEEDKNRNCYFYYFEDLIRIYSEQYLFKKKYSLNNYLAYDEITFEDWFGAGDKKAVTVETDYVQMVTDNLLWRFSNDYRRFAGDRIPETEWSLETEIQWISPKLWLGGNYEVTRYSYNLDPLETIYRKIELWNKRFVTRRFTVTCNAARVLREEDYYTSGEVNLNYFLGYNIDKFYAVFKYISSYQNRVDPQKAFRFGLLKNFKNGLELKVELERLYETIYAEEAEHIIRLGCGQTLGLGSGRFKGVNYDVNNLSIISGLVYLDENGNCKYDDGEKLIPDIKMSLNGRIAVSDAKGEYVYKYVQPGTYQLNFALKSLTADYTPATDIKLIRIRETENMFFDFGLTMNGAVSGKVFIDINSNGIYDQGDRPLNWVEMELDGGRKKIFTNNDGTFYFENVPLGEHTLVVKEESIPKEMMIDGAKTFTFTLKEDSLDVSDLQVRIVYKFKE
jgi:hypothetical protein